jgi:hypothetical protein
MDHSRYIIAVENICAGEELFVTYNPYPFHFQPAWMRRERLATTWNFRCDCVRCSAEYDAIRGFSCNLPNCQGFYYAKQRDLADRPTLTICSVCGSTCTQAYATQFFKE